MYGSGDLGLVRTQGYRTGQEGVLLLNTVLTIDAGANSHRGLGWEKFTDDIIRAISDNLEHVVLSCGIALLKLKLN